MKCPPISDRYRKVIYDMQGITKKRKQKPKSLLTKERFDHIKLKKNRIKIDKKNFFRLYGLIADYMDGEKYVDERAYKRRFANDSIDRAKYVMGMALENFFNIR